MNFYLDVCKEKVADVGLEEGASFGGYQAELESCPHLFAKM